MKIISSTQFQDLMKTDKRMSEGLFPDLIRRLVKNTCADDCYFAFPNGDAVYTPGWDGIVKNNQKINRFVPIGNSVWELGTNRNSLNKIKTDYEKRKNEQSEVNKSEYTYVVVTTGIINSDKKEAIHNTILKDGIFKEGRILDANDLEAWLEDHLNVAIWLLNEKGKKIEISDIALIDNEWREIIEDCTIPLNSEIFLVGNEANSDKLKQDISTKRDTNIYNISSPYGNEYAYCFTLATIIKKFDKDSRDRFIVVKSKQALDIVTASVTNQIILVKFSCFDFKFADIGDNNYIFFDSFFPSDITLNLPSRNEFLRSLKLLDLGKIKAEKLAFLADYNIIVIKRLLSRIPQHRIPFWAKEKDKCELIPLMLMNELNMEDSGDRDILKSIVGSEQDSYIDKLNYWAEMAGSPVLKKKYKFCINARNECFSFIKVDVYSNRFTSLLQKFRDILFLKENSNNSDKVIYKRIRWSERRIVDIIDGFIIISDLNRSNQIFMDSYMRELYEDLKRNSEALSRAFRYLPNVAELSPFSFMRFINNELKADFVVIKGLLKVNKELFSSNLQYLIAALKKCMGNRETANSAFEVFVNFYFHIDYSDELKKEMIEALEPISTMAGVVQIPLSVKIDRFFEIAEGKDDKKTQAIVESLYSVKNSSIMIPLSDSYRTEDEHSKISITYQEVFNMQSKAFDWLLEHKEALEKNNYINFVEACFRNADVQPIEITKEETSKLLSDINDSSDDEIKGNIYAIAKREIFRLKKSGNDKYQKLIELFESFSDGISLSDEYYKYRYILTNDRFPIDCDLRDDSNNLYNRELQYRKNKQKEVLTLLLKKFGDGIIPRIIKDCSKKAWLIWETLYEFSNDKNRDIKQLIEIGEILGLNVYLSKISPEKQIAVLQAFDCHEMLLKALPYSKEIVQYIDGMSNESLFWESHMPSIVDDVSFDYIFKKYLQFNPVRLIPFFAYQYDCSYEYGVALLKRLSELSEDEQVNKLLSNEQYSLVKIVEDMDRKYYTSELAVCEFNLLKLLMGEIRDYPMGVKKYFWDNPTALSQLIIELNNIPDLNTRPIALQIYSDTIYALDGYCFVPNDYLWQKKSELKKWVDGMLIPTQGQDDSVCRLVKQAIINTLVCYPRRDDEIWPCKEVADILEFLSKKNYDDRFEAASQFYSAYINSRGLRVVNDGSDERMLSERFKMYSEKYAYNHPVVSKALEDIAENYLYESERDKEFSITGRY